MHPTGQKTWSEGWSYLSLGGLNHSLAVPAASSNSGFLPNEKVQCTPVPNIQTILGAKSFVKLVRAIFTL